MAGFTPRDIDTMTLWEFAACMDGLRVFHGGKPARGGAPEMTDARARELGIEGF